MNRFVFLFLLSLCSSGGLVNCMEREKLSDYTPGNPKEINRFIVSLCLSSELFSPYRQLVWDQFKKGTIRGAFLSPNGKTLFLAFEQGFCLWDIDKEQMIGEVQSLDVDSAVFSPDGKTVAIASSTAFGFLFLVDAETGKITKSLNCFPDSFVYSLAFNLQGNLVVALKDGLVCVVDVSTEEILLEFDTGSKAGIYPIACSPDGKTILTGGEAPASVCLWDSVMGERKKLFLSPYKLDRILTEGMPQSLAFSPDGKTFLAYFNRSDRARLFDIETEEQLKTFSGKDDALFSPDGKTAFIGGHKCTSSYDITTGNLIQKLPIAGDSLILACSTDGNTLVMVNEHIIKIYRHTLEWDDRKKKDALELYNKKGLALLLCNFNQTN